MSKTSGPRKYTLRIHWRKRPLENRGFTANTTAEAVRQMRQVVKDEYPNTALRVELLDQNDKKHMAVGRI